MSLVVRELLHGRNGANRPQSMEKSKNHVRVRHANAMSFCDFYGYPFKSKNAVREEECRKGFDFLSIESERKELEESNSHESD
ncbi:hypothetical protein KPH14_001916 [Odynerus spinipes]|uniref:Uncharacterized protein n=1 Tax=Odynerus spinipes TaxID=1348599 RepID=A0AAD9VXM6_9HYME|nr:hypothetical protein KPH14_001916 [Odynerus spinipes]